MDARAKDVMHEIVAASDEDRISFPEALAKLAAAGIERFHADLVRAEKTFYLAGGESLTLPARRVETPVAREFSAAAMSAATAASRAREIKYQALCARIMAGGCAGYIVSVSGRRVLFYGRTGEAFVEATPAA